jgi:hypothetical protein
MISSRTNAATSGLSRRGGLGEGGRDQGRGDGRGAGLAQGGGAGALGLPGGVGGFGDRAQQDQAGNQLRVAGGQGADH